MEHTRATADRLAAFTELDPAGGGESPHRSVADFVDEGMQHHRASPEELLRDRAVPAEAKVLYGWLRGAEPGPLSAPSLLEDLADALAESRRERARLERRTEELGAEIGGLREELAAADARLAATCADLQRHRNWLEGIQTSASWRLTLPLRRAKGLVVRGGRQR